MDVVKSTIDLISEHLAKVINLSINTGIIPSERKIARVIPLLKSGDQAFFVNYRPVLVLPVLNS